MVEHEEALPVRQAIALTRLAFRRLFNTKVFWATLGCAALPVLVVTLLSIVVTISGTIQERPVETGPLLRKFLEPLYLGAYLHIALFISAAAFGTQALRDEIESQTLHYLFLQPAPRWMLIPAKLAAFLLFAIPVFVLSLLAIHLILMLPLGVGPAAEFYFSASYIKSFAAQIAVIVISLAIFGAVTAALSSFFRNIFFVFFLYGWEIVTSFMPEVLKDFSITFHLKALLPFSGAMQSGLIGIPAEPPGGLQVFLVLLLTTTLSLAFASWWTGKKECLYTV